jgi:uncharacterized membrane protein
LTPQTPSSQTPPQQPPQQQAPISPVGGGAEQVREQDKVHLILSYLGVLCLIPLLTVKDSPFVQWHAKQGLALMLVGFGSTLVWMVPYLNIINCFLWPAMAVVAVMSVLKAFQGYRWRIPVIADLSEKF